MAELSGERQPDVCGEYAEQFHEEAFISRDDLIARIAELESAALTSGPGMSVYEEQARQISVAIERIESLEAERDRLLSRLAPPTADPPAP